MCNSICDRKASPQDEGYHSELCTDLQKPFPVREQACSEHKPGQQNAPDILSEQTDLFTVAVKGSEFFFHLSPVSFFSNTFCTWLSSADKHGCECDCDWQISSCRPPCACVISWGLWGMAKWWRKYFKLQNYYYYYISFTEEITVAYLQRSSFSSNLMKKITKPEEKVISNPITQVHELLKKESPQSELLKIGKLATDAKTIFWIMYFQYCKAGYFNLGVYWGLLPLCGGT